MADISIVLKAANAKKLELNFERQKNAIIDDTGLRADMPLNVGENLARLDRAFDRITGFGELTQMKLADGGVAVSDATKSLESVELYFATVGGFKDDASAVKAGKVLQARAEDKSVAALNSDEQNATPPMGFAMALAGVERDASGSVKRPLERGGNAAVARLEAAASALSGIIDAQIETMSLDQLERYVLDKAKPVDMKAEQITSMASLLLPLEK